MIFRRTLLLNAFFILLSAIAASAPSDRHDHARVSSLPAAFARLEKENHGRLGVFVLNPSTGDKTGYRAEERFAMCSTFKFLLVAAILQRVDTDRERLDRLIQIPARPLISNSPLTDVHAGGSMSVADLCHATLIRSDNTAANLLLEIIDGPAGLTHFARSIGDRVTRLDRIETSLNEATPGDSRDTTTPSDMAEDMKRVLFGKTLSDASRDRLIKWMMENQTGAKRLRASLPGDWKAGDKTGSNGETTSNDIAFFWTDRDSPVLVTAYLTECDGPEEKRAAILSEIGRLVAAESLAR